MDAAVLEWPPFRQTPTATETGKNGDSLLLVDANQV